MPKDKTETLCYSDWCQNGEDVSDLLPLVVSQRDALGRHLEVHNGGGGGRSRSQRLRNRLGNSLGTRQGLHLHRIDIENVACWEEREITPDGSNVLSRITSVHAENVLTWLMLQEGIWEF